MLLLILLVAFIYLLYIRKCPVTVARVWFCASILLVVLVNWILCAPLRIAAHKKWMQRRLSERASCVLSGVLLGKVLWLLSPHIRVRFMEGSLDWRGIETVGAICAPHTSFYDTLFFLALCPLSYLSNCKAFAKRALWKLPLLGGVIRSCGHFPVYFTSQEQNSFSVDKEKQERVTDEADKFLADGGVICFFPEGALNHTPEKLKDFRLGTFKMVLKHQLPLHYMVYYGCQEVWDPVMKGIPGFPADVFVYIGKYEYNKGASAVEVANGMREEMQTRLDSMIEKRKSEHYMPPIHEALSRGNSPESVPDKHTSAKNDSNNEAAPLSSSSAFGGLLKSIIQATENERCAPEILPYPERIVDGVAAEIVAQNKQIARLSEEEKQQAAEGNSGFSILPFKPSDIMALEVQRAQFFLCELLRCRLRKIEALAMSIFYEGKMSGDAPTQLRGMLSHNEVIVADRLAELMNKYVLQAGLQSAPRELQYLIPNPPYAEGIEVLPVPDLDQYVFCVMLDDLGVVHLGEDAVQTVHAGEIFLVPYRAFRSYILEGRVRLV